MTTAFILLILAGIAVFVVNYGGPRWFSFVAMLLAYAGGVFVGLAS